jgi:transposase
MASMSLVSIDKKIKAADKELQHLVTDRGSTLTDLHGIGPSSVARLLADVGDIHRFRDRDRFASWNGATPVDAPSGEQRATASPEWCDPEAGLQMLYKHSEGRTVQIGE